MHEHIPLYAFGRFLCGRREHQGQHIISAFFTATLGILSLSRPESTIIPATALSISSIPSVCPVGRVLLLIFDRGVAGCVVSLEPHSFCTGIAAGTRALSMLARTCCCSACTVS